MEGWLGYLAIGAFVGFFAGLLGIGGGAVIIQMLAWLFQAQGIPREHLPHVFEKFFRVPGRTQGRGTGLGLAIVREIVMAHHGEVACDSRPGKGTVFTLTLPVWKG